MGSNNIQTLYHLFDQKAEAIEFNVDKESGVTGKQFMELKLKDNLLIALMVRLLFQVVLTALWLEILWLL